MQKSVCGPGCPCPRFPRHVLHTRAGCGRQPFAKLKIQVYLLATFISLCGGDHKRGRSGGPDFSFGRLFGLPTVAKRRLGCSGVCFAPVPTRGAWAPSPESIPLRRGIPAARCLFGQFAYQTKSTNAPVIRVHLVCW